MMSKIPSSVLSEHFSSLMQGKRLVSAIFTTFKFEPQFFETQILPVFLDIPLSHSDPIKLVQLEDALRSLPGSIAVYYDHHGLVAEGGPAKLDIRRIPVRQKAIFHPKNVLALIEDVEPDEDGRRPRTLLCACASANLTRAGWWENVEVAHVEQIREGDTSMRDDLRGFLTALLRTRAGQTSDATEHDHDAIEDIRGFLKAIDQPVTRSVKGRLRTRLHYGTSSLIEFLSSIASKELSGLNLEVLSPYFDKTPYSAVLESMADLFHPGAIRVLLPRDQNGTALCTQELHAWVVSVRAKWGALSGDLTRLGKSENASLRTVHAKVYRFFEPKRGGREFIYAGSSNLTSPGCLKGGNWESGFFIETTSDGKPDWWLQTDESTPSDYRPRAEEDTSASSGGTALEIRFDWTRHKGDFRWTDDRVCPALSVRHKGTNLFDVAGLARNVWSPLTEEQNRQLLEVLHSTSLLEVVGESSDPGLVLVQEDGMASRPSLLLELNTNDILKAWALLSQEQRNEFINQRASVPSEDDPMLARLPRLPETSTLFDRFAGIFHAFGCLETRVHDALREERVREADYLVFGEKYDSLGSLIRRVAAEAESDNERYVENYVVMLSAKQFLKELARDVPDFWNKNKEKASHLWDGLERTRNLREELSKGHGMSDFLDWFDHWFLQRAKPLEAPQ